MKTRLMFLFVLVALVLTPMLAQTTMDPGGTVTLPQATLDLNALSAAAIGLITWVVTELAGKAGLTFRKDLIALLVGPLTAIAGGAVNLLPNAGWKGWLTTIVMGVVGSLLAGVGNDYVAKPVANPMATEAQMKKGN